MKGNYTSFEQLPLFLTAEDLAKLLNISRGGAYSLMHSGGFPTMRIGKKMMVSKDKLMEWIAKQGKA